MGCCFLPGQVVVVPSADGGGPTDDDSVAYAATQWLSLNEVGDQHPEVPVPYVKRVPVGEEQETARRLGDDQSIIAALPNYYIRPAQTTLCDGLVKMNENFVGSALRSLCHPWPGIVWPGQPSRPPSNASDTVAVLLVDSGFYEQGKPVRTLDACDPMDRQTPASAAHGTIVYQLVKRIAGNTIRLTPARALGASSTLASLMMALYLAEMHDPPDVINLSLSVLAEHGRCPRCRYQERGDFTEAQLGKAIGGVTARADRRSGPVWVAAAGNDTDLVLMPASLSNVVAVGSYNSAASQVSKYADYRAVPSERFVMAEGGENTDAQCIARAGSSITTKRLYGTSFAAPQVAAAIAVHIAYLRRAGVSGPMTPRILDWLRECAKPVLNHDVERHGLGVLVADPFRFGPNTLPFPPAMFAPGNRVLPNDVREAVNRAAYFLWDEAGRPPLRDAEFWFKARRSLQLPSWLE